MSDILQQVTSAESLPLSWSNHPYNGSGMFSIQPSSFPMSFIGVRPESGSEASPYSLLFLLPYSSQAFPPINICHVLGWFLLLKRPQLTTNQHSWLTHCRKAKERATFSHHSFNITFLYSFTMNIYAYRPHFMNTLIANKAYQKLAT
jgi:hypothetical protein